MENKVKKYTTNILDIFDTVVKTYERNEETIKNTEDEINDINHEIELSKPKDMYHGYLMYIALRDLRVKRREAKDENEMLQEMYEYAKSQSGIEVSKKMQKLQGHSVYTEQKLQNRSYRPRQRDDLTITDDFTEVKCKKPFEELMKDFKSTKIVTKNGKLRK